MYVIPVCLYSIHIHKFNLLLIVNMPLSVSNLRYFSFMELPASSYPLVLRPIQIQIK